MTYREEQQQRNIQTAREVAALMDGYTVDEERLKDCDWEVTLLGVPDLAFQISNGRVIIQAYAPQELLAEVRYKGSGSHKITVAEDRGAEVIVKEINRRLLPDLLAFIEVLKVRKAASDEYEAKRKAAMQRLIDVTGAKPSNYGDYSTINVHGGEFKLNGPDSVTITLRSVKLSEAEQVIESIKERRKASATAKVS